MISSPLYYGRNILKEALRAGALIETIYVENRAAYDFVQKFPLSSQKKLKFEEGIPKSIRKEAHQGVAFNTNHEFYVPYSIERIRSAPYILLCNHIEDVHNLGSIARCAVGFGVKFLIHEAEGSASLTSGALKSSAGCAFHLSFISVPKLSTVAKALQKSGHSIVGLDIQESSVPLYDWKPPQKLALVLGSEKNGIESEMRELCDPLVKIPTEPTFNSLNVSHAASIAMSWAHRRV